MIKIYRTAQGTVIEADNLYYLAQEGWDYFVNNDNALRDVQSALANATPVGGQSIKELLPCISDGQELWACGVTYYRSMLGRQEESKISGSADFYSKVYDAERPECFFKCNPHRVAGYGGNVRIRKDSSWNVPEPELTLVVTSSGKIIGYTIGNDMSSRSIEGENPLYLPQAKTYDGCAALGPCVCLTEQPLPPDTVISLEVKRNDHVIVTGSVSTKQMKRTQQELVSYVYRESSFPGGCLIMTGTGIVPENDFTLCSGDIINISITGIGCLTNIVE
jgi:2-dehydro-3-deoxy-D-arabinonate dehydratase